jgi:hypothetical protein
MANTNTEGAESTEVHGEGRKEVLNAEVAEGAEQGKDRPRITRMGRI